MQSYDLSVIIVSFNTKELLEKCLLSIEKSIKNHKYEIIIVDNGSSDGSIEMIQEKFKEVKLIINDSNVGFAKANNQAIRQSEGKFLLLLNSDTFLQENSLDKMINFLEQNPKAAALTPKILNIDHSIQSKGNHFPSLFFILLSLLKVQSYVPKKLLYKLFPKYFWDENNERKVDWISGCCMLMRKEAINEIGLLPEDYFMFYEDVEWCLKAKEKGYEVWYYPSSSIIHIGSASENKQIVEISIKSTLLFFEKNKKKFYGFLFLLSELILSVESFILNLLFSFNKKKIKSSFAKLKYEIKRFILLLKLYKKT